MARYYLTSLGCRLNQAEMAALGRQLEMLGHGVVPLPQEADFVVVNTCAVTAEAEGKSRRLVRRLRRAAPQAQVLVMGCYAELDSTLGGVKEPGIVVLPMDEKRKALEDAAMLAEPTGGQPGAGSERSRTRAFVRIQDGCDNRCSYCIVWRLRGPQRSRTPEDIRREVSLLLEDGYLEIVLTGVHLGQYGADLGLGEGALSSLVRLLLQDSRLRRLRLSSIEPWDAARLDLSLWQDDRLCPHLHLPLQSGSDRVLRLMGRRYSAQQYLDLVAALRGTIPDLALTTDVIVGFPGETEEDLQCTVDVLKRVGFLRVHVFPYSARPGTPAAGMDGQVPIPERERRARLLRELANELSLVYRRQYVGRCMPVLWEKKKGDLWVGLTPNYIRAYCQADLPLRNSILPARMLAPYHDGLLAELA